MLSAADMRGAIPIEPIPVSPIATVSPKEALRLYGAKLRALRAQRSLTQIAPAKQLVRGSCKYVVNLEAGYKLASL